MKPFHDPKLKKIEFLDERYYTYDGVKFFPGVTTILDVYPKGFGFDQWLKDVGSNASQIVDRAADFGSKIHKVSERLDNGEEIRWDEGYSLEEWQCINKFVTFHKNVNPVLVANEISMCSEKLKYGGTLDRVYTINGKRWLLDIKTNNFLYKTHELQLSAYATMWNEKFPDTQIEATGILWLKAQTRTEKVDHAKGIMQGIGWQVKTFDRHYTDAYKVFEHTHRIWREENPNYVPHNLVYPDTLSLNKTIE